MTYPTLLGLPEARFDALDGVALAVFGAAEATPYGAEASHSAGAPGTIRAASAVLAKQLGQFDFDLGATLLPEKGDYRGMVDCGDVATDTADPEGNRARIAAATAKVLAAGAVPVLLGGDDSVPIPFLAGFADHGPVCILQIDAHVDWADKVQGEPLGYGSPMRRAAEMPHVTGMVQVGIRGLGSGESWQHDDARAWGSRLVTSYDLHDGGDQAVLAHVPAGARVVIAIDCDGLDPAA